MKVTPDLTQDRTVPISIRQELHNLPILVMLRFGGGGWLVEGEKRDWLVLGRSWHQRNNKDYASQA